MVIKLNHSDMWTSAIIIHILSSVKMLIWEWGCHLLARKPLFELFMLCLVYQLEKNKFVANTPFLFFPLILPFLSLESCGALDFEYVNRQLVLSKSQQSLSSMFS